MTHLNRKLYRASPFVVTLLLAVMVGCDAMEIADETDSTSIEIRSTADGALLGTVKVMDTEDGAVFTPALTGLTTGQHGFHVHEKPDCGNAGKDAGGHFDPMNTGRHEGPYGNGHLGDLPLLIVNEAGAATGAILAPRVNVSDLDGRSLMVHGGGDNYSDIPAALGGGGARVACGVVPAL